MIMKNFILGLCILAGSGVYAQGNPYDGFGREYFRSVSRVVEDISANGFRGVDQKSLDHYVSLTTVNPSVNPEIARSVYELSNTKGLRAADVIRRSKFSKQWQEFSVKMVSDLGSLGEEGRARFFEKLVAEISGSKMSDTEKELSLKLASIVQQAYINYDLTGTATGSQNLAGRWRCGFDGEDGYELTNPGACVGAAAVVGAAIGGSVCGVACAIGGAIVFAVVTAILVC